jgi:hypothetical protein
MTRVFTSFHNSLAREFCEESKNGLSERLEKVQCLLQDAQGNIATPRNKTESSDKLARTVCKILYSNRLSNGFSGTLS